MKSIPPRNGNIVKFLKNHHQEQLDKLVLKNQLEIGIVEDIRNFVKQKCNLEKSYAEGLLKLSTNFQNKKIPNIPDVESHINDADHANTEEKRKRRVSLTADDNISGLSPDLHQRIGVSDISGSLNPSNAWQVWKTILDENEKVAQARLAAIQVLQEDIIADSKNHKQLKTQHVKKNIDHLLIVQKDLQNCVQDYQKVKNIYQEEAGLVRIEDKANKRGRKVCKKVSPSASTTNAYVLSMLTANTHQDRYFMTDLQQAIKNLELGVYQRIKKYFSLISRTELLTALAAKTSFTKIKELSEVTNRQYNVACYMSYYPVLEHHVQYQYEPVDSEEPCISTKQDEGHVLRKECRKWAIRVARETKAIQDMEKRLHTLKEHSNDCSTSSGSGSKDIPVDQVEAKVEELEHIIRRTTTSKLKEETKISFLREKLGPEVDKWLTEIPSLRNTGTEEFITKFQQQNDVELNDIPPSQSINTLDSRMQASQSMTSYAIESSEPTVFSNGLRKSSTMPLSIPSEGNHSDSEDSMYDFEDCISETDSLLGNKKKVTNNIARIPRSAQTFQLKMLDDNLSIGVNQISPTSESVSVTEQFEDARSLQSPGSFFSSSPPYDEHGASPARNKEEPVAINPRCIAMFNFIAENPDELNMIDQEELELLGEGDDEGWVKARNYKGEVGYVPRSYLEIIGGKDNKDVQSNDYMGRPFLEQGFSFSSVDYSSTSVDFHPLESIPEGVTISFREAAPPTANTKQKNHIRFCKALYDFDASNNVELSFKEGDVIKVLRTKTPSGGDDGWWEGEIHGKVGLFPSLVVEPLKGGFQESNTSSCLQTVPLQFPSGSEIKQTERLEIIEGDNPDLLKPLTPEKISNISQNKSSKPTKDKLENITLKNSETSLKVTQSIGKGSLRSHETHAKGPKDVSPSRVLINKVDRSYDAAPKEICGEKSKTEKKLIQQVDCRNGMNNVKPNLNNSDKEKKNVVYSTDPVSPYSVIVTPATPSIPRSSSSNQFSLVKYNPDKTFSLNDSNAQSSQQEPFFLHQHKNNHQPSTTDPPKVGALALESQAHNQKNRGRSRSTKPTKKPVRSKSSDGMIEYASLDFFMTDTKFTTAECSSSEKQVRFSMTTIRTPPNSPNPSFTRFSTNGGMPLVPSTNPLVRKNQNIFSNTHQPKTSESKKEKIPDLKNNFLERLDVLPESQA